MSVACVLVTNCLALTAETHNSSGGVPYGRRAWLLRNVTLPLYRWTNLFSEIIVVGEFEAGEGYTHIPAESVYHNCADALWKRQLGFDAVTNKSVEWVLFQHDDHLYDPVNRYPNGSAYGAEVLAPSRWTRARSQKGEPLNDGARSGYVNGHACLMRPTVFSQGFKWTDAPPVFQWDVEITKRLDQLGLRRTYAPELKTWDLEMGATPWT